MKSILFVCLGNICRSPLAQGIAEKIIKEEGLDLHVDSAGTGDWHIGEAPCENSIKVASLHDVDISQQRGRQITIEDFERYELIVALDQSNVENLKKIGATNLIKLGYFGYENEDVPDPFFFPGFEGFDKVFNMIEACVIQLLEDKVKNR
ncbi:low molecular weight protein-tyrosine-phosphatase [Campylobacterota bacterium]